MLTTTTTSLFALLASLANAGTLLWDGRLNAYNSTSILSQWSWSNPVGPYQYYIHGSSPIDSYVALSSSYKNPADVNSDQGLQLSIDETSSWNGQTMLRTELIPQTTAAINAGSSVFYHFSLSHTDLNPPTTGNEHQVCFFESHFTELKYGLSGTDLQWFADSEVHWNTTFEAGVWHNMAYGIDFDAGTVELWHSTGGEELMLVAGPVEASTVSDGKDWHLGVLRLPSKSGGDDAVRESWRFSGVWIESGEVTKSIGGGNGSCSSG